MTDKRAPHDKPPTPISISPDEVQYLERAIMPMNRVAKFTGVPISTLRNWLDRELFVPASVGDRVAGKHRRFSKLDCLKIKIAHSLTSMSFDASAAINISELISNSMMTRIINKLPINTNDVWFVFYDQEGFRIIVGSACKIAERAISYITISVAEVSSFLDDMGNPPDSPTHTEQRTSL